MTLVRASAILAVSLIGFALACASTPDAPDNAAEETARGYLAGLDGCQVKVDDNEGRTVLCGQHMGALVPASKVDGQTLVDTFLDGVQKGAGVSVEREAADRDIAGTVASGTHAWFTNKNGVLVDGWLGVVTAGGDRRLVGCFLMGQSVADRCPQLLQLLRDAPLMAAGRYPINVLGAHVMPPSGCDLSENRAACGTYELQWYPDGERLTVDLFVGKFVEAGSTVAARAAVPCRVQDGAATCERVGLSSAAGDVDVTFAHPGSGGVMLCIVERGQALPALCASVLTVEAP
jgi:hypothetical protein